MVENVGEVMELILIIMLSSLFMPIIMVFIRSKLSLAKNFFDTLALLATLIFGNIASIAIYQVIKDETVFMTNIHGLFLNPYFLLTGAYLGVYFLYVLLLAIYPDWFN